MHFCCGGGRPNFCMKFTPEILGASVPFTVCTYCMSLSILKILIYFQIVESFNCYPVVWCFRGAPNIRSHYHACRRYSQASSLRSGKHHAAPAPASFPLQIYWTVVFCSGSIRTSLNSKQKELNRQISHLYTIQVATVQYVVWSINDGFSNQTV